MALTPDGIGGLVGLIPDGAALTRLATGATWSEGPVWLPSSRRLRWSDIPGDRILEWWAQDGLLHVYRSGVEFTNGRTLDNDGHVIQCSHGNRRVERDVDGTVTPVVDHYGSARLNSPNDVVVDIDGSVWFSDPSYGIAAGTVEGHAGEREYHDHFVFRHDERKGRTRPVVVDVEEPNGLAFSPDGALLYVSDTSAASRVAGNHHIRVYDVVGGRCKNGRVFAVVSPGVPDGLRVDERGNVWSSAQDGVHVFAPDGQAIGVVPVPETVANLCFGGDDGRRLFIAATTGLYGLDTTVRDAAAVRREAVRP
ncbi:MAG: SMP-30/gluconolactonase/LRE family protein [Micrococcales bacterium]|nr:SMP-30/gluconolactonase/LRE family protein [Micrococcales bacterium]